MSAWESARGRQIHAEQLDITSAGTAEQMAAFTVPQGFSVYIQALGSNTGAIFIGNTQAAAQSGTARFQLAPGETIRLRLVNFDDVWYDAATSGNDVQAICEFDPIL